MKNVISHRTNGFHFWKRKNPGS